MDLLVMMETVFFVIRCLLMYQEPDAIPLLPHLTVRRRRALFIDSAYFKRCLQAERYHQISKGLSPRTHLGVVCVNEWIGVSMFIHSWCHNQLWNLICSVRLNQGHSHLTQLADSWTWNAQYSFPVNVYFFHMRIIFLIFIISRLSSWSFGNCLSVLAV